MTDHTAVRDDVTTAPGAPARPTRSRLGTTWVGLAGFAVVLVLLLVFILENSGQAKIEYFGATGHLPQGVLVLLGAVAGVLLTGLVGSLRIAQIRIRSRRGRA